MQVHDILAYLWTDIAWDITRKDTKIFSWIELNKIYLIKFYLEIYMSLNQDLELIVTTTANSPHITYHHNCLVLQELQAVTVTLTLIHSLRC